MNVLWRNNCLWWRLKRIIENLNPWYLILQHDHVFPTTCICQDFKLSSSCHWECWMQVKKMDQNGYSRDCVNKGISSFVSGSYYMYNKCVKNFLVKYKFLFCGRQIATLPNSPHHDPSYIIFFPSRASVFIFCLSWDLSCGQNLLKRMHVWS